LQMKGNPSALPSSFCFAILEEQHLENLSHHRMELNLRGKKPCRFPALL
jgi:hypothetical protein